MIKWHNDHGRKDLPWQKEINPYRVWISEIMLQQTQVSTVIPYFEKFIKRFPDITSLSKASLDDVLGHWSGLGYYARARNLHKAAQIIVSELKSEFPSTIESLEELPGVGRSTAGAILSIAKQTPAPILDGNVKRVLARFHMITGYPENSQIKKYFWDLAEQHTPKTQFQTYTQAIMDLGAMLCTRSKPKCEDCPINHRCKAFKEDSVAEFPNKKPKKEKPKRSARFFIIRNNRGEVLIEQRNRKGVWQGLWGAIERPVETEASDLCHELGLKPSSIKRLESGTTFRHTFSHYHLQIEPIYISTSLTGRTSVKSNSSTMWVLPTNLLKDQAIGISKADKLVFDCLDNP